MSEVVFSSKVYGEEAAIRAFEKGPDVEPDECILVEAIREEDGYRIVRLIERSYVMDRWGDEGDPVYMTPQEAITLARVLIEAARQLGVEEEE